MKKNICFKSILSLLLLILVMAILMGCGNSYTITLNLEDGSTYRIVNIRDGEFLSVDEPTKEGYTFAGWYLENNIIDSNYVFSSDATLIGKFTINQYTYKFIVDDEIIKQETLDYGSDIIYPNNPIKSGDQENKYVFEKWDNDATKLLKDEVFNAIFSSDAQTYEYIFMNDDGTIIKEEIDTYGKEIVYPEDPSKAEDDEYIYTFNGWDRDDKVLTEDVIFIATYSSVKKQYTYKFVNEDGTILKEETVDYGTMPTEPETIPTKEETNDCKYVFVGWDKTISTVKSNIIYTATYEEIPQVDKITLDGKTISILGDSISTFYADGSEMNSYYGGENQFFYPRYSTTIKTVNKTWWYQLIKNNNLKLGVNNSWSGSCAVGSGSSAGNSDGRINTIDDSGNPDIVIIYLGTNDCCSMYDVNKYKSAIETMIKKIRNLCDSQIFLTTLGYTNYSKNNYTDSHRLLYNETLRTIAKKYNCGIVPLDEYIVDDSYMFYLEDSLHYNAKGATLLSKIYEKAIKDYNDIPFEEEIIVEHKEKLPEGIIAKITATANSGFWDNEAYKNNVYLAKSSSSENPIYSKRIEISKHSSGVYYVSNIYNSNEKAKYNSDYVLLISDSHVEYKLLVEGLSGVKIGTIVEFDEKFNFPVDLLFKDTSVNLEENIEPEIPDDNVIDEGKLKVGAYNTGVWTMYENSVIVYSHDTIDKGSKYSNFYIIKLAKTDSSDQFIISGLKPVDENETFEECDYYVLIYRELDSKTFYENANVGDKITVEGDITSGNCYLVFE